MAQLAEGDMYATALKKKRGSSPPRRGMPGEEKNKKRRKDKTSGEEWIGGDLSRGKGRNWDQIIL